MARYNRKIINNEIKNSDKKNRFSPSVLFILLAIMAAIGYTAGFYHYQIEAALGPIFGYKAHSGDINLNSLRETYNTLAANYDGKIDQAALIEGANRGMVDAVDDEYTVYMNAQEASDYGDSLSGNIGAGIGAEINVKNGKVTIVRTLKDNAAINAGLKADDIILKINDQSTDGWSSEKAVSQIKGEEGTTVKLTIQRGNTIKEYVITRAIINNPSVESSMDGNLGVITISRFDTETGNLAKTAAQGLKNQGVKGVILDLRNNGGGYVSSATSVAGLWLDDKVVVTERSGGVVRESTRTGGNAILGGIPTIVLVNGYSASASEIVAGALKEHNAARLVGENTFGKGSVQELIPLSLGAELKVTVARWYTPNGVNISKDGITPDVKIGYTQKDIDSGVDPQLDKAKKLLGY